MDFEKDLKIDPYSLDEELIKQPSTYFKWAKLSAEAERDRDRAKEKLDVLRSVIELDVRRDPETYGIQKVTEASIASTVTTNSDVKEASDEYIRSKYNAKIAQAGVEALNHKKSALEYLVKLHLASYYSEPADSQSKKIVEEAVRENERKILNRRKNEA